MAEEKVRPKERRKKKETCVPRMIIEKGAGEAVGRVKGGKRGELPYSLYLAPPFN